jgi:serine/threonine protein kinase
MCRCLSLTQRHILLTALDIAQGLEYLHHSSRRMVHRDLSANNILLTTSSSDDRGFRAMLSDFGETLVRLSLLSSHPP